MIWGVMRFLSLILNAIYVEYLNDTSIIQMGKYFSLKIPFTHWSKHVLSQVFVNKLYKCLELTWPTASRWSKTNLSSAPVSKGSLCVVDLMSRFFFSWPSVPNMLIKTSASVPDPASLHVFVSISYKAFFTSGLNEKEF